MRSLGNKFALLYELWTFFRIVHELSVLEGPSVQSGRLTSGPFQTDFAAGGTFEWASGVRLVYNQHFSRSWKKPRHSYSVPPRPDIALSMPDGPSPISLDRALANVPGSKVREALNVSEIGTAGPGEEPRKAENPAEAGSC